MYDYTHQATVRQVPDTSRCG